MTADGTVGGGALATGVAGLETGGATEVGATDAGAWAPPGIADEPGAGAGSFDRSAADAVGRVAGLDCAACGVDGLGSVVGAGRFCRYFVTSGAAAVPVVTTVGENWAVAEGPPDDGVEALPADGAVPSDESSNFGVSVTGSSMS